MRNAEKVKKKPWPRSNTVLVCDANGPYPIRPMGIQPKKSFRKGSVKEELNIFSLQNSE